MDSWLLNHFPGRFLDEISDQMDVFRFLRALEARGIESVEKVREQYFNGGNNKVKPTDEQWEQIRQHDDIMADLLLDGDD